MSKKAAGDQDYILTRLGKPLHAINLLYCYYPHEETWPVRASKAYARQSRAASRPRRAVARRAYSSFAALLPRWRLPFTWSQIESVVESIKESGNGV